MLDKKISTQHLALLEICYDPQSFESISRFLNLNEKDTKKELRVLKKERLLEEIKGPTYKFWQLTKKGKNLLNL